LKLNLFQLPSLVNIFSHGAIISGRTQTLEHGMMRQVFYHCATTAGQILQN
jgi:hypothetical protein